MGLHVVVDEDWLVRRGGRGGLVREIRWMSVL